EDAKIFLDGAAGRSRRQTRGPLDTGAVAGIGLDQTGINGEAFTADQALIDAPLQDRREQAPQQIAVAEAAVAVLREGRMIGHFAVETLSTKPAIRQVEVHLLAQSPLRADAKAVADDQHANQQLRVDRWPTHLAVERRQFLPQRVEFDEAIDRPQKVLLRHMPFERKLVKQSLLLDSPLPHHCTSPPAPRPGVNQRPQKRATLSFSTQSGKPGSSRSQDGLPLSAESGHFA